MESNDYVFFNNLPKEIQLQIIQESPTFVQLKQSINSEKPACDLSISKQELQTYIDTLPNSFIIYGLNDNEFRITMFYKKEASNNYDVVKNLYMVLEDKIESTMDVSKNSDLQRDIKHIYDKYNMIFFDVNTVYGVVNARVNCNNVNSIVNYVKKYVEDIKNIKVKYESNMYKLFNLAIIESYMESTHKTLERKIIKFIHANDVNTILFNNNKPINQSAYDNMIITLNTNINNYYDDIMGLLLVFSNTF